MRFQQCDRIEERLLDLRGGLGIGADEPYPPDHPLPHLRGGGRDPIVIRIRHRHPRDPPRGSQLIHFARPSIVEHPLVAPFVAEFLEQDRNEAGGGIGGMNRRFGVQSLEAFYNRRGILKALVGWGHYQRDDRKLRVLLILRLARTAAEDPLMRYPLEAEPGANLDRVGRHLGPEDAILIGHRTILERFGNNRALARTLAWLHSMCQHSAHDTHRTAAARGCHPTKSPSVFPRACSDSKSATTGATSEMPFSRKRWRRGCDGCPCAPKSNSAWECRARPSGWCASKEASG